MKIKRYIDYYKKNPQEYWFKRKIWGWGWTPVKWQGWLVILTGIGILVAGIYIGETDDAPSATLIAILVMISLFIFFGHWKGEKPHWKWGLKNKSNK